VSTGHGDLVHVANAVFHATGKRVRELPITPDKLVNPADRASHE
jgi:hypothetical protein